MKYAIPIPADDSLECDIAELLARPMGRPSQKTVVRHESFLYQADSCKMAQQVIAKTKFQV